MLQFNYRLILNFFELRFTLLLRQLKDFGLPKYMFIPILLAFCGGEFYLIKRYPTWGAYVVLLTHLQFLFSLADKQRNDFLRINFSNTDYYWI